MTLILRPSKSHIWTRCPAAPTMEGAALPRADNDAAKEGTCAHWVADTVLKGDATAAEDMQGKTHPNGWMVDEEMTFHVQRFINLIRERGGVTNTEQKVSLTENIEGTLDCSTSLNGGTTLCVDDLKYGYRIVEVQDNTAMVIYGAAELIRLADPRITHVQLGIYQPRAFHVLGIYRTVTMTVEELGLLAVWVIDRGEECLKPNPVAIPGEHCANCKADTSCMALIKTLGDGYQTLMDTRQRVLNGEELSRQWRFVKLMKKLLDSHESSLDAETEARLRGGEHIPHIALGPTYGHRKFTVKPEVVKAITGKDPWKPTLKTPAEMEREGVPESIMDAIARAPVVGQKVRKFEGKDIAKMFKS